MHISSDGARSVRHGEFRRTKSSLETQFSNSFSAHCTSFTPGRSGFTADIALKAVHIVHIFLDEWEEYCFLQSLEYRSTRNQAASTTVASNQRNPQFIIIPCCQIAMSSGSNEIMP
jgi:hypothetical protein